MLVLSRKKDGEIVIGDNIVIVVKRIVGNRVVLGIEAPEEVNIVRGELVRPCDHEGNEYEVNP